MSIPDPEAQAHSEIAPEHPPSPDPTETTLPADVVSPATLRGSFRLVRVVGTDVYVHWSWFVAAYFLIQDRPTAYTSMAWNVAEYLAGFGIVLLHEFGHVLGCRRMGGRADRVVMWPLGGLAFVAPPPTAKAELVTTVAGPLVNLVLAPVLIGLAVLTAPADEFDPFSNTYELLNALAWFNLTVLAFNLLPAFPLDGGRILHAVLWPWLGRRRALAAAAGVGLIAGVGLGAWAFTAHEWWILAVAAFLVLGSLGGLSHVRLLGELKGAPRRTLVRCPNCHAHPPRGEFWRCSRCLGRFDLFATSVDCSKGGNHATDVSCLECQLQIKPRDWLPTEAVKVDGG